MNIHGGCKQNRQTFVVVVCELFIFNQQKNMAYSLLKYIKQHSFIHQIMGVKNYYIDIYTYITLQRKQRKVKYNLLCLLERKLAHSRSIGLSFKGVQRRLSNKSITNFEDLQLHLSSIKLLTLKLGLTLVSSKVYQIMKLIICILDIIRRYK